MFQKSYIRDRPSPNIRGNRPAPRRAEPARKASNSRASDSRSKRPGPSYGGADRGGRPAAADRGRVGAKDGRGEKVFHLQFLCRYFKIDG